MARNPSNATQTRMRKETFLGGREERVSAFDRLVFIGRDSLTSDVQRPLRAIPARTGAQDPLNISFVSPNMRASSYLSKLSLDCLTLLRLNQEATPDGASHHAHWRPCAKLLQSRVSL